MLNAFVDWRFLGDDDDDGWDQLRCLYAYHAPRASEVFYIGKAWGKTVYQRWLREAKEKFWNDLERDRGISSHRPAIGTVALLEGNRLSHALLCDIESLLIQQLQPWGNIQCRFTRIARPDLVVTCRGASWRNQPRMFRDG